MQVTVTAYDLGRIRISSTHIQGPLTDEHLQRSLEEYRQMLCTMQREQRQLISFIDMSGVREMTAHQRRIQSDWNRSIESVQKAVTLGLALIAPGAVIRGIITAVFWFSPPSAPYILCAKLSEAVTWALDECSKRGVNVSEAVAKECRECFGVEADGGSAKQRAQQRT